jgi:predicted DNA-binding transcriptional regulator YafY
MAKDTSNDAALSPHRAARLYRLLTMLSDRAKSREFLLKKLRLDLRGFYRDIEYLRSLGIEISTENGSYLLMTGFDDSLSMLPIPDLGLSVRDALLLVSGNLTARKKLKKKVEAVLGPIDSIA